jgi:hypothetical protein
MTERMTKSAKLARALALREAALSIIRRAGVWESAKVGSHEVKLLSAQLGGIHISYRTPFQQIPQAGEALKYRAAQLGLKTPKNLPYGLDVWAPKKVMNIEWDDQGNVALVSLRPGAWETELTNLAKREVT